MSRRKVYWRSSAVEYWKLNFDGASRGNPGNSGLGVCIRDSHGTVEALTTSPLPIGTNNMVEVQDLLAGLILAKQNNFQMLHIEGDSLVIIDDCIHRKVYSWKLKYILNQVWLGF